jgi:hypothetical protein
MATALPFLSALRTRTSASSPSLNNAKSIAGIFRASAESAGSPSVTVHLADGVLVVNDRRIANPRFTPNAISWSQKTPSHFSSGSLYVMANGGFLAGTIASGKDESNAVVTPVNLVTDDLRFVTEVCRDEKASKQVWEPGPPLTLSVNFPGAGELPTVTADIGDKPVDETAVLPSEADNNVRLGIGIEEFNCESEFGDMGYAVPMTSVIKLGFDGNSFSGSMTACGAPPESSYAWRGTLVQTPKPAALAQAVEPLIDQPLTLADLMSQTTDGAVEVAKTKFQDFILYAMDDWRDKLFGSLKPNLNAMEQGVVSDNQSLYSDHMCDAFILKQLSVLSKEQGGPSDPISGSDQDKLTYFWQQGITKATGYYDVSDRLTQISWLQVDPRIQEYIEDKSQFWAKVLFDQLVTPQFLDMTVMGFMQDGFRLTMVNRYAELLLALSPHLTEMMGNPGNQTPCTLATLYHTKFLSWYGARLNSRVSYDSPEAVASFEAFLPGWIAGVRARIAAGIQDPNHPLSAGQQTAYADIESAFAAAERAQGGMAALSHEIAAGIAAESGSNLFAKISSWTKDNLTKKKIAGGVLRAINLAGFCFSLQSVVGAFKNWDDLNDVQKAQTVMTTGELGIDLLNMVADTGIAETLTQLFTKTLGWGGLGEAVEVGLFRNLKEAQGFYDESLKFMKAEFGAGDKTRFSEIFETGSKFMKGFAVAAAAAAVGFSAYKVYEDFDGHGGVAEEVLDTLMLTANVVMLAGEIAALTVGECLMATLGPVGAVFGVVLAIVSIFLPSPPPDRPSDDYMDQRGKNFLTSLPNPPPDWDQPQTVAAMALVA